MFSSLIISRAISLILINPKYKPKKIKKKNHSSNVSTELSLLIGKDDKENKIFIPEKGLFQNILITGTIGSGKTSSAMYPFTKQLISYKSNNKDEKLGFLILDVKGNFLKEVLKYAKEYNRLDDVITINLSGKYKYNPLDKPHLKPSVLANQLKDILLLFSPNNTESFFIDKAETILQEAIKLCRIYNNGYVNFLEIHKLITSKEYYDEKISYIRNLFINNSLSKKTFYDLTKSIEFFENEFFQLDSRNLNILRAEITRITNIFVSDKEICDVFSPEKNKLNFHGFKSVINSGKIIVLDMNINEYKNLSKLIAAYLKLDFQQEVMINLKEDKIKRKLVFISDEYSEYVTLSDSNFFSQSREAKCINIIATQSYTSILNTLNNKNATNVIIQSLVNKIWFRSDDIFTIESAQKQLGKTEKERISKTISESAKQTSYSYITNSLISNNSNLSQSLNKYTQFDFCYDTNFFTRMLNTFSALCFISTGNSILPPLKINLIPHFKKKG